ncbi:MAG: DUF302 domain-containing protein [bacterium]|nr:DUF302 domain-containing protein [bacterium]MCP4798899.1 DUF302 domain-containing protein [bacterium]
MPSFAYLIIGLLVGSLLTCVALYKAAPGMMLIEDTIDLSIEDALSKLEKAAEDMGWKVPKVHMISDSVKNAGYDVRPVAVLELCHPKLAGMMLNDEKGRRIAPMMPCRVALYENVDGTITVSRMNSGMMSKMFGGIIASGMDEAAGQNEEIFASILGK